MRLLVVELAGLFLALFGVASGEFSHPFPIESLDGTNGVRLETTRTPKDLCGPTGFGRALAALGDINGDGYDDLLLTSADDGTFFFPPLPNPSYCVSRGRAYILFGRAGAWSPTFSLDAMDEDDGFIIRGRYVGSDLGVSAAGAGDVNGDGLSDFIVGAPGNKEVEENESVYLIFGRTSFPQQLDLESLDGSNGVRIYAANFGTKLGSACAGIGDINGDGYDDLYVGYDMIAATSDKLGGEVIYGKAGPWSANVQFWGFGEGSRTRLHFSLSDRPPVVAGLGDISGDGIDDFTLGFGSASPNSMAQAGTIYVIHGKPGGLALDFDLRILNGTNGFRIDGDAAGNYLQSVASAGDLNGDGVNEFLIGAPEFGSGNRRGQVSILEGCIASACSFPPTADAHTLASCQLLGKDASDYLGYSMGVFGHGSEGLPILILGAVAANYTGDSTVGGDGAAYFLKYDSNNLACPFTLADFGDEQGFRMDGLNGYKLPTLMTSGFDFDADGYQDTAMVEGAAAPQAVLVKGNEGPASTTYKRYIQPGDVPRVGVGTLGNVAHSAPNSRFWIKFGSGDNGSGGASLMTVTIHRNLDGLSNLPGPAANVHWIGEWDRPGWDGAGVLVKYLDSEVTGLDPARLRLYYSEDADGPWTEAQFPYINTRAKRIGGTIWSEGYFVLIEKPLARGDVDGDGALTPEDAQRAFLCALGACPIDASKSASDFCPAPDGDGVVTPADAQGIFNAYMGLAACP